MRKLNFVRIMFAALAFAALFTACQKDQVAPAGMQDISLEMREAMSGAIFTTDASCTGVNVNIFGKKQDVYLDGGPRKPGAAGLPDGDYFVKVTDPSGASLLGYTPTASVKVLYGEFVHCYQLWDILVYQNGNGGPKQGYKDTPNNGGVYKVWASKDNTFPASASKTDNFKVKKGKIDEYNLEVLKFYDANANGIHDNGEPLLDDWKIRIYDSFGFDVDRYTSVNILLLKGLYTVSEYLPAQPKWMATTPTSVNVNLTSNQTVKFGNVCLGAGGGKSKGFWSNNNGRTVLETNPGGAVALLVSLNLVNNDGTPFNPATIYEFQDWLNGPVQGYQPYMLSQQLAAMSLNVFFGYVNGNAIVYAPGAGGFVSVNNLIAAANACLADPNNCNNVEALSDALDNGNNNLNFVQAEPCYYSFGE